MLQNELEVVLEDRFRVVGGGFRVVEGGFKVVEGGFEDEFRVSKVCSGCA